MNRRELVTSIMRGTVAVGLLAACTRPGAPPATPTVPPSPTPAATSTPVTTPTPDTQIDGEGRDQQASGPAIRFAVLVPPADVTAAGAFTIVSTRADMALFFTGKVTSTVSEQVCVKLFAVRTSDNAIMLSKTWDNSSLIANIPSVFSTTWGLSAGSTTTTYRAEIGVYSPGGCATQLAYNANGLTVTHYAPTATPTATPTKTSTPTPVPPTATPTRTPTPTPLACGGVPLRRAEQRPQNASYNAAPAHTFGPTVWHWADFETWALTKSIDGSECIGGTTEQILEYYAKKYFGSGTVNWNGQQVLATDVFKAEAIVESNWDMTVPPGDGGISFGILQVKDNDVNCCWPDGRYSQQSTGYGADYAIAAIRWHFEGLSWLGSGTQGDLADSMAAWFCGCGNDGNGSYATQVKAYYDSRPWETPGW